MSTVSQVLIDGGTECSAVYFLPCLPPARRMRGCKWHATKEAAWKNRNYRNCIKCDLQICTDMRIKGNSVTRMAWCFTQPVWCLGWVGHLTSRATSVACPPADSGVTSGLGLSIAAEGRRTVRPPHHRLAAFELSPAVAGFHVRGVRIRGNGT